MEKKNIVMDIAGPTDQPDRNVLITALTEKYRLRENPRPESEWRCCSPCWEQGHKNQCSSHLAKPWLTNITRMGMGLAQPSELAVCLQAGAAVDGWYPRFERLYGGWLFSVNQPSLWKNTPSIAEIELHFLPETINFVVFFLWFTCYCNIDEHWHYPALSWLKPACVSL